MLLAVLMIITSLQAVFAQGLDNYKVNWLVDNKYVEGRGKEGLELDKPITRAEITKMLVVIEGERDKVKNLEKTPSEFIDIESNHWANGYINLAKEKGYIKGYEDGSFRPENKITYEEIITILARLHPKFKESENLGEDWSKVYIEFAKEVGILKDIDLNGLYKDFAIRQKAFELIYNFYHNQKDLIFGESDDKNIVNSEKNNSWWVWGLLLYPPHIKGEENLPVEPTPSVDKITCQQVRFFVDGKLYENERVLNGEKVDRPLNPSKDNFSFVGWVDDQGNVFDFSRKIYSDIDLFGQFKKETSTIPEVKRKISIDEIGPRKFEEGSQVNIPLYVRDENGKVKAEIEVQGLPEGLKLEGESLTGTISLLTWDQGETERNFNVKVTASYEGVKDVEEFTLTVTKVEEKTTKLKFQFDTYEFPLVASKTAIVFVEPEDTDLSFKLDNPELAQLENITSGNIGRKILPLKSGTTKLIAKAGDKVAEATITINPVKVYFRVNGGVFADGNDELIKLSDFEKINAPEEPTRQAISL